jgi:thiol-disulfide isomerase/thioredoxin
MKKRFTGVMAILCLTLTGFSQSTTTLTPFYIGDRVPDLPLNRIIRHKDSVATLSSFGHKLIILDFWNVHCGSCIRMFPLEDSLQKRFKDSVQFILVTQDSTIKTINFLHRWDSIHQMTLSIPIVTGDSLLHQLFRFRFIPHYVWLMPNGTVLAQTSEYSVNAANIRQLLTAIYAKEQELKDDGFLGDMFRFLKPSLQQMQLYSPFLQPKTKP